MNYFKNVLYSVGAIYFGCSFISGLGRTDFGGDWWLKDEVSLTGRLYSNGIPKEMTVVQYSDSISIVKISSGLTGDVKANEILRFDGQLIESMSGSHKRKVTAMKWGDKDQKTFQEITRRYAVNDTSKLEHITTDTWSIENAELVLVRKDENLVNGEVWEEKGIYQKQYNSSKSTQ